MLYKPTRREFLKYAGIGALAAMAPMGIKKAMAMPGLATIGKGATPAYPIAQPAPAAAYGFNTLALYDDFDSINTIDINNTLQPGYKWYVSQLNAKASQFNVMPASAISVAGSILTLNLPNLPGLALGSTGYIPGTPPTPIGFAAKNTGGYYEIRMAFNPNLYTGNGWPAFWIFDKLIQLNAYSNLGWSGNLCEVDFVEALGPSNVQGNDWHWTSASTFFNNTNTGMNGLISDFTVMNDYGCRIVPQSKANGGGRIERYINGTLVGANAVTDYTAAGISSKAIATAPTGWMSPLDTSAGFNVLLSSGVNWPLNIDRVQVWQ
jgi:hypothetical protein